MTVPNYRTLLFTCVASCLLTTSVIGQDRLIASAPDGTKPLEVGSSIPDVTVADAAGNAVSLQSLHQDGPAVLVFFRGGWCPFCTRHTQDLIKIYPQVKELGVNLVAISPDSPKNSTENLTKNSIPFPILSDADVNAAKAFGLAFTVDAKTLTRYKGFGIDLEKASGRDHHALPVPAVYIIDQNGKVVFAHSDTNYRQRLDTKTILAEVEKLK